MASITKPLRGSAAGPSAVLRLLQPWEGVRGQVLQPGETIIVRQSIAAAYVHAGVAELVQADDPKAWNYDEDPDGDADD